MESNNTELRTSSCDADAVAESVARVYTNLSSYLLRVHTFITLTLQHPLPPPHPPPRHWPTSMLLQPAADTPHAPAARLLLNVRGKTASADVHTSFQQTNG